MSEAVDIVRATFRQTSTPAIVQPVRTVVRVPGQESVLGSMPAHVGGADQGLFGLKAVVVNPGNARRGLDTHLGVVVVFDPVTGAPAAVLEAGSLTAIRTAAASAVATQVLARARSGIVALVGTGVQARLHLEALAATREISAARIWGRDPEKAQAVSAWAADRLDFPVQVKEVLADATRDADVVCTVTSSRTPLLFLADVAAGTHVNAVGACFPDTRELATDLVVAARVVVDQQEAARFEAGDLLLAAQDRQDALAAPVELGAVLRGESAGRTSEREVTVFESLGFAALDVATGEWVARRAADEGVGIEVAMVPEAGPLPVESVHHRLAMVAKDQ